MSNAAFKLGDKAKLAFSDETGTVFGVAEYLNGTTSYLIVYKTADNRQVEGWFEQDRLTGGTVTDAKVIEGKAKAAEAKPAEEAKPPKEAKKPKLTVEDVRAALKSHAAIEGKESAIAILKDHGADTVTDLDPDKYASVVEKAKA